MKRACCIVVLALTGCFDFTKDLATCTAVGVCPPAFTAGTLCSEDGWCWDTRLPHNPLSAVVGVTSSDAWAFGLGTTLRFNGTEWLNSGELSANLTTGVAFGPNDVFAAGDVVHHFDGTAWSIVTGPHDVISMAGASASDLWFVVDGPGSGLVHQVDGASERVDLTPQTRIRRVFVAGPKDVWAAGELGSVFHWDGVTWSVDRAPVANEPTLNTVWTNGTDVWAAGQSGVVYRKTGGQWTVLAPDVQARPYYDIAGTPDGDVWFAGFNGIIARWTGGSLKTSQLEGASTMFSINSSAAGLFTAGMGGDLQQRVGNAWKPLPDNGSVATFSSVRGLAANDLWIGSVSEVEHFDGTRWITEPTGGNGYIRDVFPVSANVLWAADSNGALHKRTAGRWTAPLMTDGELLGVWASSETDAWVVGSAEIRDAANAVRRVDSILVHVTGSMQKHLETPAADGDFEGLSAVAGLGADEVWAVGQKGRVVHVVGDVVTVIAGPPGAGDLAAIVARSSTDLWVAGEATLSHFDGTQWTAVETSGLYIVGMADDHQGGLWLCGRNGRIGHLDAARVLTTQASGTQLTLGGVTSPAPGVAIAVGENGVILKKVVAP